jgi:cation diffusion facilitator CzcD-associated flavoprotein CzcO
MTNVSTMKYGSNLTGRRNGIHVTHRSDLINWGYGLNWSDLTGRRNGSNGEYWGYRCYLTGRRNGSNLTTMINRGNRRDMTNRGSLIHRRNRAKVNYVKHMTNRRNRAKRSTVTTGSSMIYW